MLECIYGVRPFFYGYVFKKVSILDIFTWLTSHEWYLIQTKFHFVYICNAYTTFRNTMYDKSNDVTFYNMTDRDKFICLMQKHWKQLSQYIETAWDYRNSFYINKRN